MKTHLLVNSRLSAGGAGIFFVFSQALQACVSIPPRQAVYFALL